MLSPNVISYSSDLAEFHVFQRYMERELQIDVYGRPQTGNLKSYFEVNC
jgi:hypothetical protein